MDDYLAIIIFSEHNNNSLTWMHLCLQSWEQCSRESPLVIRAYTEVFPPCKFYTVLDKQPLINKQNNNFAGILWCLISCPESLSGIKTQEWSDKMSPLALSRAATMLVWLGRIKDFEKGSDSSTQEYKMLWELYRFFFYFQKKKFNKSKSIKDKTSLFKMGE